MVFCLRRDGGAGTLGLVAANGLVAITAGHILGNVNDDVLVHRLLFDDQLIGNVSSKDYNLGNGRDTGLIRLNRVGVAHAHPLTLKNGETVARVFTPSNPRNPMYDFDRYRGVVCVNTADI